MKLRFVFMALIIAVVFALGFSGCSASSKSRTLVVDCENEKPFEINKEGYKKEAKRQKKLDRRNTQRLKEIK